MTDISENLLNRVTAIAKKYTKHKQDQEDAIQEGLISILKTKVGQAEAYYSKRAEFAIRDHLKKERLYHNREISNTINDDKNAR